jgi:hypothetical protein
VESDLIGLKGGLNTFGYLMGNPVIYSDPRGLYVVEFKAEGPASAPGTSDTYDKDGDKWCSYVCRRVDTGEQKTLILPGAGEYCIGQYGGDSTSALGFSP